MPVSTTGRPAAVMSILVTANTRSAQASMAALDRQLAYSVKRTGAGAEAVRRSLVGLRFAAVGMAAGTAGAVAAAVQYESAFASVRKTVKATRPQFRELSDDILQLSTKIPESANALAELAGEAGALGVKRKQLIAFTKTASQLGTTTDMTSNAAGTALARLGTIMDKTTGGAFKRMGSVLVDLGNKGASFESEIAAMSLRIAGAGKQVGLTVSEVQAFAAALANVGIRAEMGGSAISRIMLAMQTSIAEGGAELELWAKTAGMSVGEFARSFEKDVPGTIAAFADGLNKIKEEGGSVQGVLVELGKAAHTSMGEVRVRDTLLRFAGATEEIARTQRIAANEWRDNNALTKEAQQRYRTLESQLQLLKNQVVKVGIEFGTSLIPDIKRVVEILSDPKLTFDEKVSQVMERVGGILEELVPKLFRIGRDFGLAMIRGIWEAFKESDLLGKLFIGGTLIRMIGGPGAIAAVGRAIGKLMLPGIAAGVSGGVAGAAAGGGISAGAAGAAGAGGGAVAGSAFSRGVQAVRGGALGATAAGVTAGATDAFETGYLKFLDKVPKIARGVGIVGAGAGLALTFMEGFNTQAMIESDNIRERIAGRLEKLPGGFFDSPLEVFGQTDAGRARERIEEILGLVDDLAAEGKELPVDQFKAFRRELQGLAIDDDLKTDLMDILRSASSGGRRLERDAKLYGDAFKKGFSLKEAKAAFISDHRTIVANYGRGTIEAQRLSEISKRALLRHVDDLVDRNKIGAKRAEEFLNRWGLSLEDLGDDYGDMTGKAQAALHRGTKDINAYTRKGAKDFGEMSSDAHDALFDIPKDVDRSGRKSEQNAKRHGPRIKRNITNPYEEADEVSVNALLNIQENTNKALAGAGVSKKVNFGIKAMSSKEVTALHKQRGGSIDIGAPTGDTVPALLERDEYVLNRKAVAKVGGPQVLDQLNFGMAPRYGKQEGGLAFALGPYTIPPIQYDPDHAGGNSHWHISGSPPSWVVGIGKALQGMGFMVGEHPAFGGVSAVHGHYGATDHYHGGAIDVNSAANETRAETAQVAALLKGKGVPSAIAEIMAPMITGQDGPMRGLSQQVANKVTAAANQFIAKHAPVETAGMAFGNVPTGPLQDMAQAMVNQAWGADQWPPFAELVNRESSWNPGAVNPSSGAAGLAQALPPSKYPPGAWPYTGPESAKKQLAWMVSYIQDRYGTPAEAIAWHDAHNWYRLGGLVKMAEGGSLPNWGSLWNTIMGPEEGRGDAIDDWMAKLRDYAPQAEVFDRIRELSPLPELYQQFADRASEDTREGLHQSVWDGLQLLSDRASKFADFAGFAAEENIEGLVNQPELDALRRNIEIYADRASRAGTLASSGLPGQTAPTSGQPLVEGANQVQWLEAQLAELFALRNRLITSQGGPFMTEGLFDGLTETGWLGRELEVIWEHRNQLIEWLRNQGAMFDRGTYDPGSKEFPGRHSDIEWWQLAFERMWVLRNKIAEAMEVLEKARKQAHQLVKDVKEKHHDLEGDIRRDESDLERYKRELERESTSDARKKDLRENIIPDLEKKLAKERYAFGVLDEKVLPKVTDKEADFEQKLRTKRGELDDIQGPGGKEGVRRDKVPDYRSLGGGLYDAGRLVEDTKRAQTEAIAEESRSLVEELNSIQGVTGIRVKEDIKAHKVDVDGGERSLIDASAHIPGVLAGFPSSHGLLGEIYSTEREIREIHKDIAELNKAGVEEIMSELDSVQGPGSSLEVMSALPAVGVLGGEIFDVQMAIADLGGDPFAEDREAMLAEQLLEAQKKNIVLTQQMPVFEQMAGIMPQYGGMFAEGGPVPGPVGVPKTIIAHGGEYVFNGKEPMVTVTLNVAEGAGVDPSKIGYEIEQHLKGDRNRARRMMGTAGAQIHRTRKTHA